MRLEDAERIAIHLTNKYAPKQVARGWTFGGFDRGRVRAGVCKYEEKKWYLSKSFTQLNPEHVMRQIMLHEIGHVLAGPGFGHGRVWLAKARAIGYTGGATYNSKDVITVETPLWWGVCQKISDHRISYHRRPSEKIFRTGRCGKCGGVLAWLNTRTGEMVVLDSGKVVVYAGVHQTRTRNTERDGPSDRVRRLHSPPAAQR